VCEKEEHEKESLKQFGCISENTKNQNQSKKLPEEE
jgi:hypothetical protein